MSSLTVAALCPLLDLPSELQLAIVMHMATASVLGPPDECSTYDDDDFVLHQRHLDEQFRDDVRNLLLARRPCTFGDITLATNEAIFREMWLVRCHPPEADENVHGVGDE